MKVKCSEIKVGKRMRKDLGDIDGLASDIKEVGLLQPIGITKDHELVFGGRRLEACKSLNYEEIEAVVIDSDKILECEAFENVSRKNFIMSERVEIRKVFKEKDIAERGKIIAKGIKVPKRGTKKLRDKLAKLSGVSHATADKENFIVAYGDQELIDSVDKNELSVNKVYNLIKKIKKESKAPSENIDNVIDTLPVDVVVDTPTEPVQVDEEDNLIKEALHMYMNY